MILTDNCLRFDVVLFRRRLIVAAVFQMAECLRRTALGACLLVRLQVCLVGKVQVLFRHAYSGL
jgi:hypothetical protein